MSYDEAKVEVFDKLLPKKGERFIQLSRQTMTVTGLVYWEYERPRQSNRGRAMRLQRGMGGWVTFSDLTGGGSCKLSEWWHRLNRGTMERLDDDV